MHPLALSVIKYVTATVPAATLVAAASGLEWLDGLTPLQGLGSGAVVVSLAFVMWRVILRAFNRADEIQRNIIDELRQENARLIADRERLQHEAKQERELRLSLEQAGIVDRRRRGDGWEDDLSVDISS